MVCSRSASAEVSEAALMPIASALRIWSCISAISGEMTSAVRRGQRRQLVAERLARARRHHRERVLAGDHAPDHLLLHAAELVEAEDALEDFVRVGHDTLRN